MSSSPVSASASDGQLFKEKQIPLQLLAFFLPFSRSTCACAVHPREEGSIASPVHARARDRRRSSLTGIDSHLLVAGCSRPFLLIRGEGMLMALVVIRQTCHVFQHTITRRLSYEKPQSGKQMLDRTNKKQLSPEVDRTSSSTRASVNVQIGRTGPKGIAFRHNRPSSVKNIHDLTRTSRESINNKRDLSR